MNWYYINNNILIKFNDKISNYFDKCKYTCSLEYNMNDTFYGSVFFVDFNEMIFYNERLRHRYELIKAKEVNNSILYKGKYKEIGKKHHERVFTPICNYTPFYNMKYPDIKEITIVSNCNHIHGCHNRYCKIHNGELKYYYSLNSCNNEILNYKSAKYIFQV